MEIYKLEEPKEEDKVLVDVGPPEKVETLQGGQLQEQELPKVWNLEKGKSEHLEWTYSSRCSIALTYPSRSHYQRTLNEER